MYKEATPQERLSPHELWVLEQLLYDTRLSNKFTRTDGGSQTGPSGISFSQLASNVLSQNYGVTDAVAQQRILDAYYAAKQSNSPATFRGEGHRASIPVYVIEELPAGTNVAPDDLPEVVSTKALAI